MGIEKCCMPTALPLAKMLVQRIPNASKQISKHCPCHGAVLFFILANYSITIHQLSKTYGRKLLAGNLDFTFLNRETCSIHISPIVDELYIILSICDRACRIKKLFSLFSLFFQTNTLQAVVGHPTALHR